MGVIECRSTKHLDCQNFQLCHNWQVHCQDLYVFKRSFISGMTKNSVLNSTTLMVSWAHFTKLFWVLLLCWQKSSGDEEQDLLVYLPEGLAKGGKKIPLSASFYDHKDVSAGETKMMMTIRTVKICENVIFRGAQPHPGADQTWWDSFQWNASETRFGGDFPILIINHPTRSSDICRLVQAGWWCSTMEMLSARSTRNLLLFCPGSGLAWWISI